MHVHQPKIKHLTIGFVCALPTIRKSRFKRYDDDTLRSITFFICWDVRGWRGVKWLRSRLDLTLDGKVPIRGTLISSSLPLVFLNSHLLMRSRIKQNKYYTNCILMQMIVAETTTKRYNNNKTFIIYYDI